MNEKQIAAAGRTKNVTQTMDRCRNSFIDVEISSHSANALCDYIEQLEAQAGSTAEILALMAKHKAQHDEIADLKLQLDASGIKDMRNEIVFQLEQREKQVSEIAALRQDALRAATVAFGIFVLHRTDELPADAQDIAAWLEVNAFPLLSDDVGPEELFISIIRAAMAQAVQPANEGAK